MFSIGIFSKMNMVTTKTLRHYDEIGLLKPAYVDKETGYRFYTSEQLPRFYKIIALKQMGMSLQEIFRIIDNTESVEIFLNLKEKEVQENIKAEIQKMNRIKNYIKLLKGEDVMIYNPVIKRLPEVKVASMRFIAPNYSSFFEIVPKMGDEMRRQGAVCAMPPYCFNMYHDGEYKEKEIDVEVCEAVVDFCKDSDMVKYKKIEEVKKAVCVLHKGPYEMFRNTYTFIFKWIEENNYKIMGLGRESYIDGIWNKEKEEEWLTEIQIPIE